VIVYDMVFFGRDFSCVLKTTFHLFLVFKSSLPKFYRPCGWDVTHQIFKR